MRGSDERSGSLFSYVDIEDRVPRGHPLRRIRELANDALRALDGEFAQLYSSLGRPSIPPERLLRASLLQLLYSIRSERQLMDRLEFDLLFRWFVGLGIDDPVWDATSFTKNRERVLNEAIAQAFLSALLGDRKVKRLLSHEHFTVDGTLLKAWAGMKSFRRKDGGDNPPDGGRPPNAAHRLRPGSVPTARNPAVRCDRRTGRPRGTACRSAAVRRPGRPLARTRS